VPTKPANTSGGAIIAERFKPMLTASTSPVWRGLRPLRRLGTNRAPASSRQRHAIGPQDFGGVFSKVWHHAPLSLRAQQRTGARTADSVLSGTHQCQTTAGQSRIMLIQQRVEKTSDTVRPPVASRTEGCL